MNIIEAWRCFRDVDKRRIEVKLAKALWRKIWFDIGKIALSAAFLIVVALSVSGLMPSQLADLGAMIKYLYSGKTVMDVFFSAGLGVISGLTLGLNIYLLPRTYSLLNYSLRIAERHAMKKTVR